MLRYVKDDNGGLILLRRPAAVEQLPSTVNVKILIFDGLVI